MVTLFPYAPLLTPESKRRSAAFRKLLTDFPSTHFVTLATNAQGDGSPRTAVAQAAWMEKLFRQWHNRVDGELLGRRYWKKPDLRVSGWKIIENASFNVHAHLLLGVHRGTDLSNAVQVMKRSWAEVRRGGSFDCQIIFDRANLAFYCTKEFWDQASCDRADRF